MRFVLKICQTVAGVSKTSPFHQIFRIKFSGSNFWQVYKGGGILEIGGVLSYHSSRSVTKHKDHQIKYYNVDT